MKDIFNLDDVDDLPRELHRFRRKNTDKAAMKSKVLSLFEAKETLNRNEIIVGIYRETKEVVKEAKVYSLLHELIREGKIKKLGRVKCRELIQYQMQG